MAPIKKKGLEMRLGGILTQSQGDFSPEVISNEELLDRLCGWVYNGRPKGRRRPGDRKMASKYEQENILSQAKFITAIGTPLTEEEELHEEGLEIELADQWNHGISGVLVAGSMGVMQLLTEATYRRLIERAVELSTGRGEVLIGAGDTSFARTRDRIQFINQFKVDAVAVLTPFFCKFGPPELLNYYRMLADVSKAPLYLYDLPGATGVKITRETTLELAKHPNIRGIKCSDDFADTRQLIDAAPDDFRVIVAQPFLTDMLIRHGVLEHLEGIWAIMPKWTIALGQCADKGDWVGAAKYQQQMFAVRDLLIVKYGFGSFSNMMNARGIPGCFVPKPFPKLDDAKAKGLLAEPMMQKLIAEDPAMTD